MKKMMILLMSLALAMPALAQYGRPYGYNRYAPPSASLIAYGKTK